ncbi:MAG: trypsin-like peptidase domain-containing protein [Phycisphaerales bacterium]|nr:MAG: trypsin-like peptidase domain-containing protein [Phycisphaerales bacterium]
MRRFSNYGPSLIVLFTAAMVLFAGPFAVREITYHRNKAQIQQASLRLDQNGLLEQLNQAYRDIATRVEPSVVHVSAEQNGMDRWGRVVSSISTGSGWIYDDFGHVVTNYHVVRDAELTEVQLFDGDRREAELIGFDETTDIAVLRIPSGRLHPAVRAPSNQPVYQGDMVFAFGSPFDFRFSMSSGVVSGIGRSVGLIRNQLGQPAYENFIQVDAAINPGNSGGPLTNHRGEVIGMNTAIATDPNSSRQEGAFAGIGLAIPMNMIEPVVSQLIETGVVAKGYLGISGVDGDQTILEEIAAAGAREPGVVVGRIELDHPALQAGLRPDDLITRVNGNRVDSADMIRAEAQRSDEDTTTFRIWRFDVDADRGIVKAIHLPTAAARSMGGIDLLQVGDPVYREMELVGFTGRGVRIVRCQPGMPAEAAGVRRHDIVTHVNGQPIGTMDQLRSTVSSIRPGDIARLTIWRPDQRSQRGSTLEIAVPLARMNTIEVTGVLPQDQSREEIVELGIARMMTATEKAAELYGTPFHNGVLVEQVVAGSAIDGVVSPGSIIVRVGDRPISSVEEFLNTLRLYDVRRPPAVTVVDPSGQAYRIHLRTSG